MLGPTLPLPVQAAAHSQSLDPAAAEARDRKDRGTETETGAPAPGQDPRLGDATRERRRGLVEAEPERLWLRTKRLDNGQDLRAARLVLGAGPDPDPWRSPGQSRSRRLEPSSGTAGRDACAAGVQVGLEPRAGAPWRCRRIAAGIGAGRGQGPGRQSSTVGTGARHSVSPETGPGTRPKTQWAAGTGGGWRAGPVPAPARGLELLVRGAESGLIEPARRAGSALGVWAWAAPETARCQGVLRARQGGPACSDTAGPAAAAYLK